MSTTLLPSRRTTSGRRFTRIASSALLTTLMIAATVTATVTPASAYWSAGGTATAAAVTGTLPAPTDVTVLADSAGDVTVGWTTTPAAIVADGYIVTRHSGESVSGACGSGPLDLREGDTCVDPSVPDGDYTYIVTAVFASWTARSQPSAPVVVSTSVLGSARTFSVLAGTAVVDTGGTIVSGDLGVSPGTSITGVDPGLVGGDIHAGDATAASAHDALGSAYDDLSTRAADQQLVGDLGGLTLSPGTYHTGAALALTGTLTLDAGGDPDALFLFQTDAAFNTAALSTVVLLDGASAENIYWTVAGAAGTGANSFLSGTILAVGAITLGAETELIGRALSLDAVTLAANTIRFTTAAAPIISIDGGSTAVTQDVTPTVSGSSDASMGSPVTITSGAGSWSTSVGADGTWSAEIGPLPAGTHTVTAKVRNDDGNGSGATQMLTVQVDPPTIDLGTTATYSVLAAMSVVNTGATQLSGDLGVGAGGSITGFPPGIVGGSVHDGDSASTQALIDLEAALDDGSSRTPHTEIVGDLGGRTFSMGVHHSTAALSLTGTLTLDAGGDPDATFIFQTDAAFNTAAGSTVVLAGGAQAANVFWVVTGAAGTGANSFLVGTVLARGAITLGAATSLTGAALSSDTVTLASAVLDGVAPASAEPLSATVGPSGPIEAERPLHRAWVSCPQNNDERNR